MPQPPNRIKLFLRAGGLIALIVAGLCFSCDPYGGYQYWVDNKSDSTLFVILRKRDETTIKKLIIAPRTSALIDGFTSSNGLADYGDRFITRYWDSLAILLDTTKRKPIKKKYLERDSWIYSQDHTGHQGVVPTGDNFYRLNVYEDDVK
jgi:hypothetical protein